MSDRNNRPERQRLSGGAGTERGRGGRGNRGRGRCGEFMGAGGDCICSRCGERIPHNAGFPCMKERCPNCGAAMVREGSPHYRELESRRATLVKD